jgi:hypothetical protein
MLCRNSCRAVVQTPTLNHTCRKGWRAGGKFFFESEVERLEANKQYVEAASKVHTRSLWRAVRSPSPPHELRHPKGFGRCANNGKHVSGNSTPVEHTQQAHR